MALIARPHPAAMPHGEIRQVLPDMYVVQGAVGLPGPLPIRFGRNMVIVREGERLVLVNSIRLGEAGLKALEALGRVTDVLRLAANHGMDDPFYAERYKAKVWAVAGQRYTPGFATKSPDVYLEPDVAMDTTTELPLQGARLYAIQSTPPEGLLVLERHGGTIVAGDCLQHWAKPDEYFNLLGKMFMGLLGFVKPYNIGPGWLKQCKPPKAELKGILELPMTNVLTSHGEMVIGGAKELYRPAIERV